MTSDSIARPFADVSPVWRRVAAWIALAVLLLLPVAREVHLASDSDAAARVVIGEATGTTQTAPATPAGHDDDRCADCFTFHAIWAAQAALTITFAFLFVAPRTRGLARYASPTSDRTRVALVAIPRGPPALASIA